MKTAIAEKHGYICLQYGDERTEDKQGRGFVRCRNDRECQFEKGMKDEWVWEELCVTKSVEVRPAANGADAGGPSIIKSSPRPAKAISINLIIFAQSN